MSDIPNSKQIAEQAIAGMADIVRELNELREFKADAEARYATRDQIHGFALEGLRDQKRELLADSARLRAKVAYLESALESAENDTHKAQRAFHELDGKWEGVPWAALREATQRLRAYQHNEPNASVECLADGIDDWIEDTAPQPEQEPQP
jgi:chromosome segregation ATPase